MSDVVRELDCAFVAEHDYVSRYLAERLAKDDAYVFEAHYFACERCWTEVKTGNEIRALVQRGAMGSGAADHDSRAPRGRWRNWRILAIAAVLAAAAVGGLVLVRSHDSSPLRILMSKQGTTRPLEARVSGGFPYAEYQVTRGGPVGTRDEDLEEVLGEARKALRRRKTPENYRALAVTQLLVGKSDEAISTLTQAGQRFPTDAQIQSDLSAAYYTRAQQRGNPSDLDEAVEWAAKSIGQDDSLIEAYFNHALALERKGLRSRAVVAWRAYLALDTSSRWSQEVRERERRLSQPGHSELWSRHRLRLEAALRNDSKADIDWIARAFQAETREFIENELTKRWTVAVLSGDGPEASRTRSAAASLSAAYGRASGDMLPLRSLPPIDAAALRLYVAGMSRYQQALEKYRVDDVYGACPLFRDAASAFESAHSPYVLWARFYRATCDYYGGRISAAMARLEQILPAARHQKALFLLARTEWFIGLLHFVRSEPASSLTRYARALSLLEGMGDAGNAGYVHALLAENYHYLGEASRACFHRHQALVALQQQPDPLRQHNTLAGAANQLASTFPRLALQLLDADLDATRGVAGPVMASEISLLGARIEVVIGRPKEALKRLALAESRLDGAPLDPLFQLARAEVQATQGEALLSSSNLVDAERSLTDAIARFRSGEWNRRLPDVYLTRGRVYLKQGRRDLARADFRAGVREFEANLRPARSSFYFARSWGLYTELIRLEASESPLRALEALERSRARDLLDAASPRKRAEPTSIPKIQAGLSPGEVICYLVALEEGLWAWVVSPNTVRFSKSSVLPTTLEPRVREATEALRAGRPSQELLSDLHRMIVGPVQDLLPAGSTVFFVPDGFLASVPFAALRDPRTGRYFVEDHSVAIATSGSVLLQTAGRFRRGAPRQTSLLAIGDPAFSADGLSPLPPLPLAREEATAIGRLYSRADVLTAGEATASRLLERGGRYRVIHFAGHAIANHDFPELAYLAMAPETGLPGSGPLFASQISKAVFAETELVILAGCGTAAGRVASGQGSLGIARAFQAAGVPTVLATLWPISDLTGKSFSVQFHQRFSSGEDALQSLRKTQLSMIQSSDPANRHPGSWSVYELMGGGLAHRSG